MVAVVCGVALALELTVSGGDQLTVTAVTAPTSRCRLPRAAATSTGRRGVVRRQLPAPATPTCVFTASPPRSCKLRDGELETAVVDREIGLAVRVIVDGTWGFASHAELDLAVAADTARRAVGWRRRWRR